MIRKSPKAMRKLASDNADIIKAYCYSASSCDLCYEATIVNPNVLTPDISRKARETLCPVSLEVLVLEHGTPL